MATESPNQKNGAIPLVSILIPSYNHERFVVDCLESAKAASYPRLELLIIDDCSKDNNFAVASAWVQANSSRFERCEITRNPENLGIVGTLQRLFESAKGDYLAYIASDDMFHVDAFDRRVELFERNPTVDGIFGNARYISESGTVLQDRVYPVWIGKLYSSLGPSKLFASAIMLISSMPGPTMMLRAAAVRKGGSLGPLPTRLRVEDWYIYLRIAAQGRLRYLDTVVADYRGVDNSLCKPGPASTFNVEQRVASDQLNEHLMSGFNRVVLKNRLQRNVLAINQGSSLMDRIKVASLRLRGWLFLVTLLIISLAKKRNSNV